MGGLDAFGASVGGLGPLLWPVGGLGPPLGLCERSWGRSWGLCWWSGPLLGLSGRSWAGLRDHVGGLGLLLGLCRRSEVALGIYFGGLWRLLGPMMAVLCALGAYVVEKYEEPGYFENVIIFGAGARSAASGAVLGRSWILCWLSGRFWEEGSGRKVAQTRPGEGQERHAREAHVRGPRRKFFS